MMKKFATGKKGIVDEILEKAYVNPIDVKEIKNNNFVNERLELIKDYYNSEKEHNEKFKSKQLQTFFKNCAMRAILDDNSWDESFTKKLGIEFADFQEWVSFLKYSSEFINNETEEEFREYFLSKSKEVFVIEKEKYELYISKLNEKKSKGFLRQLLAQNKFNRNTLRPRLYIEYKLYDGFVEIERLKEELKTLTELYEESEITKADFVSKRRKIIVTEKQYLREKRTLFGDLFKDREGNQNFTFIRGYGIENLEQNKSVEWIRVGSKRHCEDLIKVYVKWFNTHYESEIIQYKSEHKKQQDIDRYNRKNDVKEKKLVKQAQRDRAIQLHLEGMSGSEIASILGSKKNTVNDWIREYKNTVK